MSSDALADRLFGALHAVRVSGFATGDSDELSELEAAGLVRSHESAARSGWVATPEGLAAHATEIERRRGPALTEAVTGAYEDFLAVNRQFKELCTDWQTAGAADPAARDAFVEELREICATAGAALAKGADAAPWLSRYAPRLEAAVATFAAGDDAYLISPMVDSVHTVWAEAHEDFLVTLGRERGEADE